MGSNLGPDISHYFLRVYFFSRVAKSPFIGDTIDTGVISTDFTQHLGNVDCLKQSKIYVLELRINDHTLFSMYKAVGLFSCKAGERLPLGVNRKNAFMRKAFLHTQMRAYTLSCTHTQKKEHMVT